MAVAALGLSACTGEKLVPDNGNADGKFVTVHFGAEAAIEGATKATLTPNEAETMFASAWEKDKDAICIDYYNLEMEDHLKTTGTWNGTAFAAALPTHTGMWEYRACYPNPNPANGEVPFGSERKQNGNLYNSDYDIMISSKINVDNGAAGKDDKGKDIVFNMDRKTGIAYFHLTGGPAEKVESATLSVEGGFIASQYAYISDFAFAPSEDLKEITITYKEGTAPMASNFQLWYNVLPTEYTKMTLTVETANHTMTISRAKAGNYAAGKLYKVVKGTADKWVKKVTNNNFVLHEGELVEGDYLIVYEGKAMKAAVSSNRLGCVDVTDEGKRIANSDESIIWHIAPSAEYWTIFNDNTKSFAASNGTKNQAQLLADGTDAKSLWTVTKTKDASTFEFVNKANSSATPVVNANLRNNGNYGFACYATATGGPLSLYRLEGPVDNTIPSLSVDQTSKVWAADATDAFVVKVAVNSEGGDWTVTPETLSWATIAVDKAAGTITVTPNGANETATANEATLTVTHTMDASLTYNITLTQSAAAATANDGSLAHPYTAAEAIAVIDSGTGLTGKYVKGIVKATPSFNSTYSSLTYDIESGEKTLNIYSGKDLGNAGFVGAEDLKAGDEVVVFGTLKKYNTTYELDKNNYLISINGETQIYRGLAVSDPKTVFTVGDTFEFGGKALQVWRGKADVDVTASATFSGYDMATEGKQTVTVTVGEETVTYEINVRAAGGEAPKTYTLQFGTKYNGDTTSGYSNNWSVTCEGFTWNMTNWNNNRNGWTYVKAGPKSNTNAQAKIETAAAMPEAISTITITIDDVKNGSITSIVLKSSSSNDFTKGTTIETKSNITAKGEVVFNIPTPQNGLYYQLDFTLKNTTKGNNGVAQVSKVVYTNN